MSVESSDEPIQICNCWYIINEGTDELTFICDNCKEEHLVLCPFESPYEDGTPYGVINELVKPECLSCMYSAYHRIRFCKKSGSVESL